MAVSHAHDLKKPSGGRKRRSRDKKKAELGSLPTNTLIGTDSRELLRGFGGNQKLRAKSAKTANVYDPQAKTWKKAVLTTERENAANRNFVRRNILTLGAVVSADIGDIRITSRPGQHGVVNAVLVKPKA